MTEAPFLWVARRFTRKPLRDDREDPTLNRIWHTAGLDRQRRTNTTTEGIARSGETSPKGTVTQIEDWDGRLAAVARPATIRYITDEDGTLRPMTMREMIDRGYFIVGKGPC